MVYSVFSKKTEGSVDRGKVESLALAIYPIYPPIHTYTEQAQELPRWQNYSRMYYTVLSTNIVHYAPQPT